MKKVCDIKRYEYGFYVKVAMLPNLALLKTIG